MGVPDAGGVDQAQQYAAHHRFLLHRVPGGAGHVGDNGPLTAQQGVEQGALAHIGPAQDGRGRALAEDLAPVRGGQQGPQGRLRLRQSAQEVRPVHILNVLVRVVHHGVELAGHIQQALIDGLNTPPESAPQLFHRIVGGLGGLRLNEINHRLRLGQIQTAVQKRPLGELPPARLPRSGGKEGAQPLVQHHRGAVTVEFRAVLAGVAAGAGKADGQHLVNGPAIAVQEGAQDHLPGGLVREGPPVQRAENPVTDGETALPGDTENAHGRESVSGGDSGDGVHRRGLLLCLSNHSFFLKEKRIKKEL